ncbi:MAG: ABC transporter, permease protein 2 (cluster 5, nickel/peptides/opines) [uncultured Craurococcus sp.]|uniref:ABC transporter, permease protein 2 (Cluster 5, nickel/peptides/opines) n=1 Tax=uncultured Craurococcus sp. TaxID=1135998 RepID=A0A6J4I5E2_9PROT|nr:MAG: ABC transporter, permease protein 2 (cluster 5, nickel/peptides/opines) [uncultured Craurococcus sp.]
MRDFWRRFRRNKGAVVGLVILLLVVLVAATAPWLFPGSPWEMAGAPFAPPGEMGMLLGTDSLGRDVAAGIAHGARISLLVGAVSTAAALLVGVTLGAFAGYLGGIADDAVMRFTEFFQTIPSFVLAILLVAIFTPTITSVVGAIAVVSWPPVARVVRAEFLSLRGREFVQAAEVLGKSRLAIVLTDILPNALSPIVVLSSLMVASAILLESALSFLGLGDPNLMTWGFLIGSGRSVIRLAWWMSVFPGVAIFLTVLALNLVGEGLSDALNPRLARQRGGAA